MALSDYKQLVYLNGTDLVDLIQAPKNAITKTSQLTNDIGYITSSGSVALATSATTATNLTGNSGATAGTYGPTGDITVNNNQGTGTIAIPYITVNAQGRVTSITTKNLTIKTGCSECSNCGQCSVCGRCNNCGDCGQCGYCGQCSYCAN